MIAYLSGNPIAFEEDSLILNVQGVGYEVFMPLPSLLQIQQQSSSSSLLSLHIYTVVREDALLLYGFLKSEEKQLFLKLLSVSGIGPKSALTILSGISSEDLIQAVLEEDLARLTQISGIGKKSAERLILELKDKFKNLAPTEVSKERKKNNPHKDELLSALLNLGYKQSEIDKFLNSPQDFNQNFETLLKIALKTLSRS